MRKSACDELSRVECGMWKNLFRVSGLRRDERASAPQADCGVLISLVLRIVLVLVLDAVFLFSISRTTTRTTTRTRTIGALLNL